MKRTDKTERAVAFIMLLIFFGLPSMLLAKDLYVDANRGDDANSGAKEEPFQTLQHAANEMASGDVCYIKPEKQGDYHVNKDNKGV